MIIYGCRDSKVGEAGHHVNGCGGRGRNWRVDLFKDSDVRFKGMFSKVTKGRPILDQLWAVVRIMSIQSIKFTFMLCPQILIFDCWLSRYDN